MLDTVSASMIFTAAVVSWLLVGLIGIYETVEKYRIRDGKLSLKAEVSGNGKRLLVFKWVAFAFGFVAMLVGVKNSVASSHKITDLVAKADAQAVELKLQSEKLQEQSGSMKEQSGSMKEQTGSMKEQTGSMKEQTVYIESLIRESATHKTNLENANFQLEAAKVTSDQTLAEMGKLREQYATVNAEYEKLRTAVETSGAKSDDVKNLLSIQDMDRINREKAAKLAAQKAAQERMLRATQPYIVTFNIPDGQGVSVDYEGRQDENTFVYIKVPKGVIKLQCELSDGVKWVWGTNGKIVSLSFDDNSYRQTLAKTRVTGIGGILNFNGIAGSFIEIPFPQETVPQYTITY